MHTASPFPGPAAVSALHFTCIWVAEFPGTEQLPAWHEWRTQPVWSDFYNWGQSQKKPCHSRKCFSVLGLPQTAALRGLRKSLTALPALCFPLLSAAHRLLSVRCSFLLAALQRETCLSWYWAPAAGQGHVPNPHKGGSRVQLGVMLKAGVGACCCQWGDRVGFPNLTRLYASHT